MQANERPQQKLHGKGTDKVTHGQTLQLLDQIGQVADLVKMVLKLSNILQDQKVFWRIVGLTIKNKSKRKRKVE